MTFKLGRCETWDKLSIIKYLNQIKLTFLSLTCTSFTQFNLPIRDYPNLNLRFRNTSGDPYTLAI
jgi:hypothetical protein